MISRTEIARQGLSDETLSLMYRDLFKLDARLDATMVDTEEVRLRRHRVWEEVRPHLQGDIMESPAASINAFTLGHRSAADPMAVA